MKIVIQRVQDASVKVNGRSIGSIDFGLLLLIGIHHSDTKKEADWCISKIPKLRIFQDENEMMNLSVQDVGGGILAISQFTIYGNPKKGTRPSFIEAARPEIAEPLYDYMVEQLQIKSGCKVAAGEFGEMMDVQFINKGPVTLILEK